MRFSSTKECLSSITSQLWAPAAEVMPLRLTVGGLTEDTGGTKACARLPVTLPVAALTGSVLLRDTEERGKVCMWTVVVGATREVSTVDPSLALGLVARLGRYVSADSPSTDGG
eukprot:Selendium_serpulae@DN6003_c0_g1_i3.p2